MFDGRESSIEALKARYRLIKRVVRIRLYFRLVIDSGRFEFVFKFGSSLFGVWPNLGILYSGRFSSVS